VGAGNSANRTATGVNTQTAATGKRIQYMVENFEGTCLEPLLSMCHDFNKHFIDPQQVMDVLGKDGQIIKIDPLDVMNANVRFKMKASAKMQSRMMMMQVLPQLMPMLLNPQFMEILAQQQQMTPDLKEIMMVYCDALQISPTALFRPLSPEEQQSMQANNPQVQKNQSAQALQDSRMKQMAQMQSSKEDTQLLQTVFKPVLENHGLIKQATGFDPEPPKPPVTKKK
jgi:hypothetical protein